MGIDLDRARAENMSPRKVARLLMAQPAGARVWQEIGGWKALPEHVVMQHQQIYVDTLIHHAQSGAKGSPPKPPSAPKGLIEERRRKLVQAVTHEAKAYAFKAATESPDMKKLIEERLALWGEMSQHTEASKLNKFARERMAEWQ